MSVANAAFSLMEASAGDWTPVLKFETSRIKSAATAEGFVKYMSEMKIRASMCWACGQTAGEMQAKLCGKCKQATYCSKKCQKLHWKGVHKAVCRPIPPQPSPDFYRMGVSLGDCPVDALATTLHGILGDKIGGDGTPNVLVLDDCFGKVFSGRLAEELSFLMANHVFYREFRPTLPAAIKAMNDSQLAALKDRMMNASWRYLTFPESSEFPVRLEQEVSIKPTNPLSLPPNLQFTRLPELHHLEDTVLAATIRAFPGLSMGVDQETHVTACDLEAGRIKCSPTVFHFDIDGKIQNKTLSLIYYCREEGRKPPDGGEFEYIDTSDPQNTQVRVIEPRNDRLIAYWTPVVLHRLRPIKSIGDGPNMSIQMWITSDEIIGARRMAKAQQEITRRGRLLFGPLGLSDEERGKVQPVAECKSSTQSDSKQQNRPGNGNSNQAMSASHTNAEKTLSREAIQRKFPHFSVPESQWKGLQHVLKSVGIVDSEDITPEYLREEDFRAENVPVIVHRKLFAASSRAPTLSPSVGSGSLDQPQPQPTSRDSKAAPAPAHATLARQCAVCGHVTGLHACGGCKSVLYCSREHQRQHWSAHKQSCKRSSQSGKPV